MIKKRILLIQAYNGREEPKGAIFPLGLCYIATVLVNKNYNVCIIDPNICENPYAEIKEKIREFTPDIIGLSIRNIDTLDRKDIFYYFKTIEPTVKLIKDTAPEAKIMVGGSGFSIYAEKIMQRIPEIDFGIFLEGEESVPELLQNLSTPEKVKGIFYRENGEIIFTGQRPLPDFDALPIPRRDFLDIKRYPYPLGNIGIQTKRGCASRCIYCNYPFLNGNRVRLRSPQKVVDEIEYLVNNFGIHEFMFADGVFNIPERHALEICHEIIRRNLDVQWSAWCDLKNFSNEFLAIAKKAGLKRISFSPDAAHNSGLRTLQKGISIKDIKRGVNIIRKYNDIEVTFGFFGSIPGQTFTDTLKTIYMYLKINFFLFSRKRSGAGIDWIRVESHTVLHRIAIKEGVINKNTELLPEKEEDLSKLFYFAPSVQLGNLLIELVVWIIERLLKPSLQSIKQLVINLMPTHNFKN